MSLSKEDIINIFQSLPIGIILLDHNYNSQFINKYAESILVKDSTHSIIDTIHEQASILSNDSNKFTLKNLKIKVKNNELYLYLLLIRNKVENKYLCFLAPSKINMLLSDIDTIEKQFDDILNASYDGIIITDKNLITKKINSAYQKITGADPSKLINKHANEFVKQGIVSEIAVAKAHKAKQRVSMVQAYSFDKVHLITSTPIFDENNNITMFISNIRDMTALYKMQEDLKNMSDKITGFNNKKNLNPINKIVSHAKIVYRSDIMERLMLLIHQLSKVDSNLIIYGETGVGKGLLARTIHELSTRHSGPFIKVNCSALPENLIESELFGYESGAFTGAQKGGKNGLIQAADKGIIFLDEIGEFPYTLQPKLLEFLQDGEFIKVGSTKSTKVDVRVIAATNQNLFQMVQQKTFRKDLYYRLNVVPITVPPLREHKTDISLLIDHYSGIINNKYNFNKSFSSDAISILSNYSWPGNIRELQNLIEAAFISCSKNIISIEDTYQFIDPSNFTVNEEIKTDNGTDNDTASISYKEAMLIYEKKFLNEAITKYGSVKKAADILQVHPATIWRKI
ncbi:MAG: sigma 54-interacting transcriptional regulator [Clostridia bacterium]|jgi:PAS domain S-box-containing protein|nr:sigma 54-interacting transcriptional regulator [Clostridia bacterium]